MTSFRRITRRRSNSGKRPMDASAFSVGNVVPPAAHAEEVLVTGPDNHYLAFGIGNRYCVNHLHIASGVIRAHLYRSSVQSAVVFHVPPGIFSSVAPSKPCNSGFTSFFNCGAFAG